MAISNDPIALGVNAVTAPGKTAIGERTSSVYIASAESGTGRSIIALGLLHHLAGKVAKVGVFRPIIGPGDDRILGLLVPQTTAGLSYEQCAGVSYQRLQDDPEDAIDTIIDRFEAVANQCDAVVIVGSDYTDVDTPTELSVNARIAVNLGAAVLLSVRAGDRSPQEVADVVEACLDELSAQHAFTAAVVANRCRPPEMTGVAYALKRFEPKTYVLPEEPRLAAPSVAEVQCAVAGRLLSGDTELVQREVTGVLLAGMTAEHLLEQLTDGAVVITSGDRTDIVLAVASAQAAEGFPSLSALILTGGLELYRSITALVSGLRLRLPMIATTLDAFAAGSVAGSTRARLTATSQHKIDTALAVTARHVDMAELLQRLSIPIPTVVTPQMFEYQLLQRARADRKHIVLPEGEDDRILRAAGKVVQHGVADLTILGEETQIHSRAAELGVDLSAATVVNPQTSQLCGKFAEQIVELRKHKGVTLEDAQQMVHDCAYFGTMLVYNGIVDAMVSGSVHTTAHTVRPALQIINSKPGVSTVSSIVLMCLADRVLAYGDCSIVRDPTVEQLADIAISSAQTASKFGIEPRVAMLSYSTGTSGSGPDVDKVAQATELVRQRAPELLVDGPMQYDAAVDPTTGASKAPGSPVAGRATVLIVPDLDTGNNLVKAVQRSAGALAIGPVLQGLNKPVNDLSRGAFVDDIVYTVAVTAIQAQQRH